MKSSNHRTFAKGLRKINITLATRLVGVAVFFLASAGAQTGVWSPPVAISPGGQGSEASAAIDGNGNSVAAWIERLPSVDQIWSSSQPFGGNFGTPTVVFSPLGTSSSQGPCDCPEVRITTAGFATAVWLDGNGNVFTADRPAASGWTPAKELVTHAASPIQNVFFVMNSQGDAAVVWTAGNSVLAMLRPAGGTWTAQQTVVTEPNVRTGPHVIANHAGIGDNGAVIVTWDAFNVTCNARNRCSSSNFTLHASRQNPGTGTWADSGALLGPVTTGNVTHDARVALDAAGNAILVSLQSLGVYVSATQGSSGGAWSAFNTAVIPNGITEVSGLASDAAGHVTFLYEVIANNNTSQVQAVNSSTSSNTWSSPVVVSGSDTGAAEVFLALAPSGTAVAVWLQHTSATIGRADEIHAATRSSATAAWSSPLTVVTTSGLGNSSLGLDPEGVGVNSAGDAVVVYAGNDSAQVPTIYASNFKP
jgi:hypothetical protein